MKDCGEYQREISLLIDGELSEPQKTGLLRHIGQCRECRRVYDAFNAISLSLSAEEAPASLKAVSYTHLDVYKRQVGSRAQPYSGLRAVGFSGRHMWTKAAATAITTTTTSAG